MEVPQQLQPIIIEGCPVFESEMLAQNEEKLPKGGLYRIKGTGNLMIKY